MISSLILFAFNILLIFRLILLSSAASDPEAKHYRGIYRETVKDGWYEKPSIEWGWPLEEAGKVG